MYIYIYIGVFPGVHFIFINIQGEKKTGIIDFSHFLYLKIQNSFGTLKKNKNPIFFVEKIKFKKKILRKMFILLFSKISSKLIKIE